MALEGRLAMHGGGAPPDYFSGISDDLYSFLLLHDFDGFPRIKSALPKWPGSDFWGAHMGKAVPNDSLKEAHAFWLGVKRKFSELGSVRIKDCTVVDYGAGWGRVSRLVAKDVVPHRLFAIDPNSDLLSNAQECGLSCEYVLSDWQSEQPLSVDDADIAFSFGVFTHTSPKLMENMFRRLAEMLRSGGLLSITVRPAALLYADAGEVSLFSAEEREHAIRRYLDGKMTFKPYTGETDWGVLFSPASCIAEFAGPAFELLEEVPFLQNWTHKILHFRRI